MLGVALMRTTQSPRIANDIIPGSETVFQDTGEIYDATAIDAQSDSRLAC